MIGTTLDDAAGEAFDKGARLLGLGYPGGAELERLAAQRRPGAVPASRSRCSAGPGHDFSFSGLKTALLYAVRGDGRRPAADLAASYQRAIVAVAGRPDDGGLARHRAADTLAVVGGVAAQRRAARGVRGGVRGRGRARWRWRRPSCAPTTPR